MWPVSSSFLTALTGSHAVEIDATVTLPNGSTSAVLLSGGQVTASGASGVRRQLEATFVSSRNSVSFLRSTLRTDGGKVAVRRGIRYPNGRTEMCPVGVFRIDRVEDDLAQPGAVKVTAPDLMARVVDDRFRQPQTSSAGISIPEQIRRLIAASVPAVPMLDDSNITTSVRSGIVWEQDRWQAVNDLATSIGCEVFATPDGWFRLRVAKSLANAADWLVSSGPRGVLVGGQRLATREGVRNSIVASSSATDGTAPVYAVVEDTDPASPTCVTGPFGRVPGFYASPLLTTTAQCAAAARTILARSIGARATLSVSTLVNPALEVGDRIDVYMPDGTYQQHIVDSFTLPLDIDTAMSISTRTAQDLGDLQ